MTQRDIELGPICILWNQEDTGRNVSTDAVITASPGSLKVM
jgi:hypothetical protein